MKIYLASPWFRNGEDVAMEWLRSKLRERGYEVHSPQELTIPNAWGMSNDEWAHKVFMADIDAIDKCDEVWAINWGLYSDTGTAWECGYAYAKGKTVRQLCYNGTNGGDFSLMMLQGCDDYCELLDYLMDTPYDKSNFTPNQK